MAVKPRIGLAAVMAGIALITACPVFAQQPSVQQLFDQATSLLDGNKLNEALAAFEALESRTPKISNRNLALVRVRKGEALMGLSRLDEAMSSLRSGLETLPANDATLKPVRYSALMMLANIGKSALDYGAAVQNYRAADTTASNTNERISALAGAVSTGMFFDGNQALNEANMALALLDPAAKDGKDIRAQLRTLKARTLLNLGRFKEARAELLTATRELGGLTFKVNIQDIQTRSDNAIAAYLAGAEEEARKYLVYTGAGAMKFDFGAGAEMVPPPCGGPDALQPNDVAVVEFSIADDGSVTRATPIYSSRQGPVALAFADAVAAWSWTPEQVKNIPPFFRALTRVELRCTNAIPRPWIPDLFTSDVDSWLASKNVPELQVPDQGIAGKAKALLSELSSREAQFGRESPALIPPLVGLGGNAVIPFDERASYIIRALAIARAAQAPGEVIAALTLRTPVKQAPQNRTTGIRPNLQEPAIQASPRAIAAFNLYLAESSYFRKRFDEATQYLELIRSASGLDKDDPLRSAALVRLASVNLAKGNIREAEAAFKESGLTSEQCALVDMGPRLKRLPASSDDFPFEVLRWGMEGWVAVENDLLASGKTVNVRAVVAYPPLIFNKAATQVVSRARFEVSFRPQGELACGGQSRPVTFRIPG